MTTANLIAGLQILQKYGSSHGYDTCADHDFFGFHCDRRTPPSLDDMKKLWELDWLVEDDTIDRDDGNTELDPDCDYLRWYAYV